MPHFPLGVAQQPFDPDDPVTASVRARDLGFSHIDVRYGIDPDTLALPVGWYVTYPEPLQGRTAMPALPPGEGQWEETVRLFRAAPGSLIEPLKLSVVNSVETARAIMAEVPGLRLLVDTGHVADWGGDPIEMLELADHIQLRQGCPGATQLHVDDPRGVVDFAAVLRRLEQIEYKGLLTIEYFDRPTWGWPLEDPLGWTMDLARHVRALMGEDA